MNGLIKNLFKFVFIFMLFCLFLYTIQLGHQKYTQIEKITLNSRNDFNGSIINVIINRVPEKDIFKSSEYQTNIALSYWNEWQKYPKINNWKDYNVETCNTIIPGIKEIDFNNIYWQTVSNGDKSEYFLYNAYYDNRGDNNFVRIIATQRHIAKLKLWCLLYFDNKWQSIKTESEKYVDSDGGPYDVLMFSCPVPKSIGNIVPKSVSLIPSERCPDRVSNSLRVIYEKPEKSKEMFGVCHKALRFSADDLSIRLIEWLELLKILGTHKVYLYVLGIHPKMEKTLNYYQNIGFVDWKPLTLPGEQPNNKYLYQLYADSLGFRFWSTELVESFDCFYRNIHKYEYIGIFDIDEVIVPKSADNWKQLFQQIHNRRNVDKSSTASYTFVSTRVFSDIEDNSNDTAKYLYSMSHLHRGILRYRDMPKAIHSTSMVKQMSHHLNRGCLDANKCKTHLVNNQMAICLHLRIGWKVKDECIDKSCVNYDPVLLKYKNTLDSNMKRVMNEIDF